jgi:hypothetical protein
MNDGKLVVGIPSCKKKCFPSPDVTDVGNSSIFSSLSNSALPVPRAIRKSIDSTAGSYYRSYIESTTAF